MHEIPAYPADYRQVLTREAWVQHLADCPNYRMSSRDPVPVNESWSAKCDSCKVWFTTISSSEATP